MILLHLLNEHEFIFNQSIRSWSDTYYDFEYISNFKRMLAENQNNVYLDLDRLMDDKENEFINPADTVLKREHLFKIAGKKKKAPIVWFVSHCDTKSKREAFVKQLEK